MLGEVVRDHPRPKVLRIGMGTLDVSSIKASRDSLCLRYINMRDAGAGALSQFLPMAVLQLDVRRSGVGDIGYRLVSGCVRLRRINGICFDE